MCMYLEYNTVLNRIKSYYTVLPKIGSIISTNSIIPINNIIPVITDGNEALLNN